MASLLPSDLVREICPTAIGEHAWQLFLLGGLYSFTGLLSIFELSKSFSSGHYLLSFRNCFLVLSCWCMFQRAVLVLLPLAPWDLFWLFFLSLAFPLYIQFVTYSLLALFLARVLYVVENNDRFVSRVLYPGYFACCFFLFVFNVAQVFVSKHDWNPSSHTHQFDKGIAGYGAVVFGVLIVAIIVFGARVVRLLSKVPMPPAKRRKTRKYVMLLVAYSCFFVLRAVWNITYFFGANPLQVLISSWDTPASKDRYYTAFLIFYTVMEIIPTAIVVLTLMTVLPVKKPTSSPQSDQPRTRPIRSLNPNPKTPLLS